MKAAIYARYSSDRQSESSIEDQVRLCREQIETDGHEIGEIYTDRATSGVSLLRPGIQALFRGIDELLFSLLPQLERFEGKLRVSHQQLATEGSLDSPRGDGQMDQLPAAELSSKP